MRRRRYCVPGEACQGFAGRLRIVTSKALRRLIESCLAIAVMAAAALPAYAVDVPFKGSSPAAIALIGGEVQVGFNNMVPALPHVKSNRLRALGVSGPTRWSGLPDVPTITASGLPGYEALQWYGVLVPAGTPAAIVSRLNEAIQAVLQLPEVKEQLASEGGEVVGGTPKDFAVYMEREIGKWTKVVKAANIRPE